MKKIILIIMFLVSISIVRALEVPLSSVTNPEDLTQINDNLNFIKDNYEADIRFYIVDSKNSVTGESLLIFQHGFSKKMKTWNTLVFYNMQKNKLEIIIQKDCDFVYNYLKGLKEKDFIKNVLDEKNPSYSEISNMFLQISDDFKNTAQSLGRDTCSAETTPQLQLRTGEYIVPPEVLRAMYVVVMKEKWEFANPVGLFVSKNFLESNLFDFLPFVESSKKNFIALLKEKTSLSDNDIEHFYQLITTKGNIVLTEDYEDSELFHERIHKIISEKLTNGEIDSLMSSRMSFLNLLDELDSSPGIVWTLFAGQTAMSIKLGSWQEIYAYMMQYEKYPKSQGSSEYIDEDVYTLFASKYLEAYKIYQKVFDMASD